MFEMSDSGHQHGDAALVGLRHCVRVADASARLNDGSNSVLRCERHGVVERQETVGSEHEPLGVAGLSRLLEGDFG